MTGAFCLLLALPVGPLALAAWAGLEPFDLPGLWMAQDTDCTVSREARPEFVKQGRASLRLAFRIAPEDVGRLHWIVAARRDLRFNPPRRMRLWLRASSTDVPLCLSLRDEDGTEFVWELRAESPNRWERKVLTLDDAEVFAVHPRATKRLDSPVTRLALFVRCEKTRRRARVEFWVDGLEAEWEGPKFPPPRGPTIVNSLDEAEGFVADGCEARLERGEAVEGEGCLRLTWRVDEKGPRWMTLRFENLRLPIPRAVSFWLKPLHPLPLAFVLDDADGTRVTWRLPAMSVGE